MIARLKSFLRSATRRGRLEADMAEELQFHLEARAADLERTGLTRSESLRRARVEFGPPSTHIENMRHSLGLRWLDELFADITRLHPEVKTLEMETFHLCALLALSTGVF